MPSKQRLLYLPILAVAAILFVVIYIIARKDSSSLTMGIQWISQQIEGFAIPITNTPKCPANFRFFNDARGESFCCGGTVNPYSHTCTAKGANTLCAFRRNMKDPRGANLPSLPLCSEVVTHGHRKQESAFCPPSMPHYAAGTKKCCRTATDAEGTDCLQQDNSHANGYCVVEGAWNTGAGVQQCSNLKLYEDVKCPPGLQKRPWKLGPSEVSLYGNVASGIEIPMCANIDGGCFPDSTIDAMQKKGIYGGKQKGTWKYSCSNWEKIHIRRDKTGKMDTSYP